MGRYDNQVQTELLVFGENARGECKKLTLKETPAKGGGQAKKSFDLRSCYTDDNGELQFTKKGITIPDEEWEAVISAMIREINYEDIQEIEEALNERKQKLGYNE